MNHFLKKQMFFSGSCKESLHSGIGSKVVPTVSVCGVALVVPLVCWGTAAPWHRARSLVRGCLPGLRC